MHSLYIVCSIDTTPYRMYDICTHAHNPSVKVVLHPSFSFRNQSDCWKFLHVHWEKTLRKRPPRCEQVYKTDYFIQDPSPWKYLSFRQCQQSSQTAVNCWCVRRLILFSQYIWLLMYMRQHIQKVWSAHAWCYLSYFEYRHKKHWNYMCSQKKAD